MLGSEVYPAYKKIETHTHTHICKDKWNRLTIFLNVEIPGVGSVCTSPWWYWSKATRDVVQLLNSVMIITTSITLYSGSTVTQPLNGCWAWNTTNYCSVNIEGALIRIRVNNTKSESRADQLTTMIFSKVTPCGTDSDQYIGSYESRTRINGLVSFWSPLTVTCTLADPVGVYPKWPSFLASWTEMTCTE